MIHDDTDVYDVESHAWSMKTTRITTVLGAGRPFNLHVSSKFSRTAIQLQLEKL